MKIAFDAKRAFNNGTGLGNYSRILLNALMRDYPDNDYLLFSPKVKDEYLNQLEDGFQLFLPGSTSSVGRPMQTIGAVSTGLKSLGAINAWWRSWGITRDLIRERAPIYHGLSGELPFNIHKSGIKTVVTIHDLIFLKHTEQYPLIDRQFYKRKTAYAVKHADKIIAVSNETKQDIISHYHVPDRKIEVIYQSVSPIFYKGINPGTPKEKTDTKYILNVGSFFPRKNQIKLIEAYALIANQIEEELWLVGTDGTTKPQILQTIKDKGLQSRVKILYNISNNELPSLYRNASVFVFPSLFEGFGIPVLEALFSGTPVIATKGGAIEEAAGPGSLFINPNSADDIAAKILQVLSNEPLRSKMIKEGFAHAQTMTDTAFAQKTMQLYRSI